MLDDARCQAEGNHLTRAQLPDFPLWIPRATGWLHPLAEVNFRKAKAPGDSLIDWYRGYWRFPSPLGDDELESRGNSPGLFHRPRRLCPPTTPCPANPPANPEAAP